AASHRHWRPRAAPRPSIAHDALPLRSGLPNSYRVRARDGYVPHEEEAAPVGQLARLRLLRTVRLRGRSLARRRVLSQPVLQRPSTVMVLRLWSRAGAATG